jgi:glycosyltransferase involved in cell wall biosynthesis
MRILQVIHSIDADDGGTIEGVKQYCNIFRAAGHEADVASMDSPEYVRNCAFPAKVFGLGPGRGIYGYAPRAIPWLRENRSSYDLVIVVGIWQYCTLAVYRALAGSGTSYAVFVQGMLDPYFKRRYPLKHLKKAIYWRFILQRTLRDANAVFFTCEEEKLLARQSFSGYRAHEVVVPLGTRGPECDTAAAAEEFLARFPHLRGKRLALCLGRIHPKKAIDILIESFAQTFATHPEWHLVIAGPDQIGWQNNLETIAVKLGVADRIAWTGMLKDALKWGAFATSEIFVLPSHQENFGIVVAEALACGLPAIISDKVNIWREIESYQAGFVGDDTVAGTTASLRRWLALGEQEIADVRRRGRKCFDEQFNMDVTGKRLMEIVESLARSNPRTAPSSPAALPAEEN